MQVALATNRVLQHGPSQGRPSTMQIFAGGLATLMVARASRLRIGLLCTCCSAVIRRCGRVRQRLDPGGDIHPVTIDVVADVLTPLIV